MTIRILLTFLLFAAVGVLNFLLNPVALIGAGQSAAGQFANSDMAYVTSTFGMRFFANVAVPGAAVIFFLALIWWRYLKLIFGVVDAEAEGLEKVMRDRQRDLTRRESEAGTSSRRGGPKRAAAILIGALVLLAFAPRAEAYYDKTDYTEAFFILPSESAFYIPDVGANKDSQAAFGSEKYYRENKIAAKRFIIPHVKLEGSGAWSNYYVPAGRLIIVPRAPYSRQWVSAADRGTSAKNEGFKCQSKEGLDIGVGISIAASVSEEDSPVFLYNFGTKPPTGDRNDPNVTFTSVFYAKSLTEVMDTVIHSSVQGLVCEELTALSLDENNAKAKETMGKIRANVEKYLKSVGITLNFIGYADTFEFEKPVQASINRAYIAKNDLVVAQQLAPHATTLQLLANAEAVRTLAGKWNGATPTSVSLWWIPSGVSEFVTNLVSPSKK